MILVVIVKICVIVFCYFFIKKFENRKGVVYGVWMFVNIGMNLIFIDRKVIKIDIIGVIVIGINNKGLKIIGSLKIKGLLMLKNVGINEIFDMVFILDECLMMVIVIVKLIV